MKKFKPQEILELDRELEKVATYMRFSLSASQSADPVHDGADDKALAALRWSLLAERRILWNSNKRYSKIVSKGKMAGFRTRPTSCEAH